MFTSYYEATFKGIKILNIVILSDCHSLSFMAGHSGDKDLTFTGRIGCGI